MGKWNGISYLVLSGICYTFIHYLLYHQNCRRRSLDRSEFSHHPHCTGEFKISNFWMTDYAFGHVAAITECKHIKKLSEKTKQDTS